MEWVRLWHDLPNDPKWRTIARTSRQPISLVISIYVHMMVSASNATERGRTQNWNDEDIAAALDVETDQVKSVRDAMQGRVIDGDLLTGWNKRQPQREDNAADRAKKWREVKKCERDRTQPNAEQRPDTDTEQIQSSKKASPKNGSAEKGSRLSIDALPPEWEAWVVEKFSWTPQKAKSTFDKFQDFWKDKPGGDGRKLNWLGTWRNWCRNEVERGGSSSQGLIPFMDRNQVRRAETLSMVGMLRRAN